MMDITYSVLPKFFQHMDAYQLARLVREVGLDTVNLVIRDGYWVCDAHLATELPVFIKALGDEGLVVPFATTGYEADHLLANPEPLAIMADNGVKQFRMGYFWMRNGDARASFDDARSKMESMERLCESYNIQAVYQVHHGTLISSAFAAWTLVRNIHPKYIGIELDPGNQAHEGYEAWDKSVNLLGDYLVAVGIKDVAWVKRRRSADEHSKGWHNQWVGLSDGVTDWYELLRALNVQQFAGTFAFMPFYHENEPDELRRQLRKDVEYLRQAQRDVEAE